MGIKSKQFSKGYFIEKARIVKCTDVSGTKAHESFENADDLAIELELDIGRTFNPLLRIGGSMKWETTVNEDGVTLPVAVDFGSAWKVDAVFTAFGIRFGENGVPEIDEIEPHIPMEICDALEGREIVKLRYRAHNGSWSGFRDYDRIVAIREVESLRDATERLETLFLKDLTAGWIKGFFAEQDDNVADEKTTLVGDEPMPF